jgi:hypothetical protein
VTIIKVINEQNYLEERQSGQNELDRKFALLDELNNKSISELDLKKGLAELFKDPTIWAYGTLRDKQGDPLRLWPYQDSFVNDRNRFVQVTASNQIGKTYGMIVKALHHAIHVPNASVVIVSRSEQQAIMILDEIKWMMKRAKMPYQELVGEIENRTELHIEGPDNTVAVIRCFPPTTSVLGFPATLEILDEVGFWEKVGDLTPTEYYDQVLEPRTNQTKNWAHSFLTMGQICMISNPNGQQGLMWRTYSEDERFNQYVFCWLSCKHNTVEEYNLARNRLPSYRFASIYAAEYVSVDGGFITLEEYRRFARANVDFVIPPGSSLYLGGDFAGEDVKGKSRDRNVLYGAIHVPNPNNPVFPKTRIVYRMVWPAGTPKKIVYEEIERLSQLASISRFAYDKVGVGDSVKNDLIERGILNEYQIESLTYSLPNKSDVYLNFQSMLKQDLVEGRDIPELRDQLLSLKVEQPEGSVHLKIHHKREGIHDDEPDALANVCWVARLSGSAPVSVSIIEFGSVEDLHNQDGEEPECKHHSRHHDKFGNLICSNPDCGEEL